MAAKDGSHPGLTLFGQRFRLADTTRSESALGTYPLEEVASQDCGSTTTGLPVIRLAGETVDGMGPLHEIDVLQEERQRRHPRRLFRFVSRALPVLLTAMVIYIYYVYAIHVCIQYLLKVRQSVLQACLYLVAFTTFILLFFFSYALSIFRAPGSPSTPPVRASPTPIPSTTTPYQKQHVLTDPVQVDTDEAVGQDLSPAAVPRTERAPSLSRSRSISNSTSMRSIGQHSNPQLVSIVATPKYPTASVAPATHGTYAGSFPLQSGSESANIQGVTNVATGRTIQGHVGDSSSESEGNGVVVESGRVSIEIPHQVTASIPALRSRHPSDNNSGDSQQPIATLSVSKRDGLPRWCDICKVVKPDRSHHCSECNSCVLRMDHHCPWVNGCIGFGNYKYFYLFIFYGSVSSIWVVATMVPILVQVFAAPGVSSYENSASFNNPTQSLDIQWVVITAIAFLLMLMIVSFTGAHTSYILSNQTTIETLQDVRKTFIRVQYQKMDRAPGEISDLLPLGAGMLPSFMSEIEYNVVVIDQGERLWDQGSRLTNWNSVMGPTWWLWFVPYHNTLGDGIHDVYNEQVYSRLVGDALAQARVQAVNFGLPSDLGSSCNSAAANDRNIGMSEERVAAGVTGARVALLPPPPRPDYGSANDLGALGYPSSTKPIARDSSDASPEDSLHASVAINMDVHRLKTSAGRPSIPRKSSGPSGSILVPSIRPGSPDENPTTLSSADFGHPTQTDQSEYVLDYYYQSRRPSQLDIPQGLNADEGSASQQGGSGSGGIQSSGYSTPKRSTRNQSSRQRSPKSLSASSARRRQRTMSGGTSGTSGSYAGPIKEFGMGLGMDGVPVDSGTGLKLISGHRGWSSQSQAHGHGKGYPRQQQQD